MKTRILSIISAAACLLSLSACSDNTTPALSRVVPGELDPLPVSSFVLTNPGDREQVLFTATWTQTQFYMDGSKSPSPVAPVNYTLLAAQAGNEFDEPATLAITTDLSARINTREFNLILLDSLGATAGEAIDIELRLLTTYGQGTVREVVSDSRLPLTITPYQDRDALQPLYIYGDFNNWNNSNTATMLPMFKENSNNRNHIYTYTGYMAAGSFRMIPGESLGTSLSYGDNGGGTMAYAQSVNSFVNPTSGFKTLTVNLSALTYSFQEYDASSARVFTIVGFIGEFCNWENEPVMTRWSAENNHLWRLTYTLAPLGNNETHNVKFRAERSWNSRWAALDPDDLPYGRTVFLTADEADPNIVLRSGGQYDIYFNDLTGHYIIRPAN